jgi:hypothetical protein
MKSSCHFLFNHLGLPTPWILIYDDSILQFYLPSDLVLAESETYITTDGQSASLSWNKAPIWGLRPDFCYCQTVAGLMTWGALSEKRTGLSFTIVSCPRQRSHFWVRVPWDSLPYFTVSDSRLPFSSPPTTRRATVEVFDPASYGNFRKCKYSSWGSRKNLNSTGISV